jgi:hypothetical protein
MHRLSTHVVTFLAFAALSLTALANDGRNWPLRETIDLSSGFGDFRQGHFHGGIDLRTDGKVGKPVFCPVDGSLWRVKMSYDGYGKGLYVKDKLGYIYVFGHLSSFPLKIDKPVKAAQIAAQRYYQDLYFPEDSIEVSAGEVIAFSGESGVGAPHLHFEKRSPDNVPLNPLTHGFRLDDNIAPVFERLSFKLVDDSSLFNNGSRQIFFPLKPGSKADVYTLDTVIYLHRPFGLLVDGFDRMRAGGMQQTIYSLSLYIDDELYYRVRYDSLDFETTAAVDVEYDYLQAVDDHKKVRLLYSKPGNDYGGSWSAFDHGGVFGLAGNERMGIHHARIVGEDCFGNTAELRFDFLWGPPGDIYSLDSAVVPSSSKGTFYFTPIKGWEALGIDSVIVAMNRGDMWGPVNESQVTRLENGSVKCEVEGRPIRNLTLKLLVVTKAGYIEDDLFNGMHPRGKPNLRFEYKVVDDGLMVGLTARAKKGYESRVELYYQDSLLGVEYPQFQTMIRYICFIPPRPEYARVDFIAVAPSRDPKVPVCDTQSVNLYAVGYKPVEDIVVDDELTIRLGKKNFHEPRFIEVKHHRIYSQSMLHMKSAHYQIFPEAFVCREDFDLVYKMRGNSKYNQATGICWLDNEKNRWVWLDNVFEDNVVTAKSTGGGSFAAIIDYYPPQMQGLNIVDGRSYSSGDQPISFLVEDTISGIEDDRNIVVKIDGQWQIVDYDPEAKRAVCHPYESMSPGRHHLAIILTDRVGHVTEKYLNFSVKGKRKSGKK